MQTQTTNAARTLSTDIALAELSTDRIDSEAEAVELLEDAIMNTRSRYSVQRFTSIAQAVTNRSHYDGAPSATQLIVECMKHLARELANNYEEEELDEQRDLYLQGLPGTYHQGFKALIDAELAAVEAAYEALSRAASLARTVRNTAPKV